MIENGEVFTYEGRSVEGIVIHNETVGELHKALNQLNIDDRALIDALFFSNGGDGMTVRQYAEKTKLPVMTVQNRKTRILGQLREILE